ncbi:hypothetical protein FGO68_gene13636 [Halteria grandinella]|uniref:Uncharacterized protein n=1 Tax=Halteria grandinella TaxID=5974 RepID=A0A8J8NBI2_HALGN|nr:hypothetical protein FGO68_gene13636 [Halteria grandinella]
MYQGNPGLQEHLRNASPVNQNQHNSTQRQMNGNSNKVHPMGNGHLQGRNGSNFQQYYSNLSKNQNNTKANLTQYATEESAGGDGESTQLIQNLQIHHNSLESQMSRTQDNLDELKKSGLGMKEEVDELIEEEIANMD